MESFKKVKIKDIAKINPDSIGIGFQCKVIEYVDISSVGVGNLTETQKVNIQNAPSRAKRLVQSGDIILSTVRPNRRSFFYFKNPKRNVVVSTGFAVLRALGNNNQRYLYYSVTNRSFTAYLTKNAQGSAYPAIDADIIYNGEIFIPQKVEDQTRIASVLSAYDDLIENNEKRIKALEEMAQLLYTEWFVKFKFPGHEKVKMVESGAEYGLVPEGWEVVKVGGLLKNIKRKVKLQTGEYQIVGLYPIVDQGKDFIAGYTDIEDAVYNENLIVFGDHSRCFKYCNFPFACGADGTQLLKTNDPEKMPQILLYYSVINAGLQNYNYARHFKFLKALNILKPDSAIAKTFAISVDQTYEQIKQLRRVNISVGKLRDFLIPQLTTGKHEVK